MLLQCHAVQSPLKQHPGSQWLLWSEETRGKGAKPSRGRFISVDFGCFGGFRFGIAHMRHRVPAKDSSTTFTLILEAANTLFLLN